jgi:hypothetical protein
MSNIRYTPSITPNTSEELPQYVKKELDNISAIVNNIADGNVEKVYVEPPKPRDGDKRYFDETGFDPGQGSGLYYYNGTKWVIYADGSAGAGDYIQVVDFNTQSATTINTPTAITWGTTTDSKGISVDVSVTSRLNITHPGNYLVSFSASLTSNNTSTKQMWMFPRVNGVDIPGSTMQHSLKVNGAIRTVSRTAIFTFAAGDYLEAMFAIDVLGLNLVSATATAFAPAVPSVTMSLLQVSD